MMAVAETTHEVVEKERVKRLMRIIVAKAKRARSNPRDFFSFVMREETTKVRIKCLPHQDVIFRFVEHFDRCVIRMPAGFSKTYTMAALSMFLLGRDPTTRGAIISAGQKQAEKVVGMVKDYIVESPELRLVFPDLQPSDRESDPWTQTKFVVKRPPGIRDPSLTAVGYRGKLPGARLNWVLVDDILTEENAGTEEQRTGVHRWFNTTVLSRRDVRGTKIVVANTPWHTDDITYRLEKAGWPTLTMDIEGNIYLTNTCSTDLVEGAELPPEGEFDCDEIRPSELHFVGGLPLSDTKGKPYRLTAHDAPEYNPHAVVQERVRAITNGELDTAKREWLDALDEVPLWPERWNRAAIDQLKRDYRNAMHEYNQLYGMKCRDDATSKVKQAWIDKCKEKARKLNIHTYVSKWNPADGPTFTGVDLATGKKKSNGFTSIFTFAVTPDKHRRILKIDSGRYGEGSKIIDLISEHFENYHSIIRVETNAAQLFLKQWARERNLHLPLRGAVTGRNKLSKAHGVESIFIEVENAAWLIPNSMQGDCPEAVERWINSMLYYDANQHTGDELMASWLAREQARESGALRRGAKSGPGQGKSGGVASLNTR